jgi:hypothetical protein
MWRIRRVKPIGGLMKLLPGKLSANFRLRQANWKDLWRVLLGRGSFGGCLKMSEAENKRMSELPDKQLEETISPLERNESDAFPERNVHFGDKSEQRAVATC